MQNEAKALENVNRKRVQRLKEKLVNFGETTLQKVLLEAEEAGVC